MPTRLSSSRLRRVGGKPTQSALACLLLLLLALLATTGMAGRALGAEPAAKPDPVRKKVALVEVDEFRAGRGELMKVSVKVKDVSAGATGIRFRMALPSDVKSKSTRAGDPAGKLVGAAVQAVEMPGSPGVWTYELTWQPQSLAYTGSVMTLEFTAPERVIRRHSVPVSETQLLLGPGKGAALDAISPTIAVSLLSNDISIFTYLASVVALIFWLSRLKPLQRFFHYLPPLIWMYFIPMISTTMGITPDTATLYDPFMTRVLLPSVLVLLLIPSDVRGIMKLGIKPLILMLLATTSIVVGAVVSFGAFTLLMPGSLPAGTWKALSALSGSWIGGSTNMMAVFISLDAPPGLLGPLVVVDTVVAYSWLGLLIALSSYQKAVDHRHGADSRVVEELAARVEAENKASARAPATADIAIMIGIAFLVGQVCLAIGAPIARTINGRWPEMAAVLSGLAWGILLMTAVGLLLSMTPVRKLDSCGASALGNAGLYLLLTSFGARANLAAVAEVPVFFGIAALWLLVHVIMLYTFVRLLKAPLFLGSTCSMANIGGTASAPVVAAAYYPSMAPVGLLLAIVGGILGTPVALFVVAVILRRIAGE